MKRTHRRWLLFLVLTLLFTLFGQGRSEHWTFVTTDKQGTHYLVDKRSLRWSEQQVEFSLRAELADGTRTSPCPYRLDFERKNLVATDRQQLEPEPVVPETAAFELYKWLSERRPHPSR